MHLISFSFQMALLQSLLKFVREWPNANLPGRWMDHCGTHEWSARNPDVTPCDFFLWGWLKEQVYSTKQTTLEDLDGQIREVMSSIPQEFMVKSVDAVSSQLEKLVANADTNIKY